MEKIRVLILGSGNMATAHAKHFTNDPRCDLVGCVDTDEANLNDFGNRFNLTNRFNSLDQALAWGGFDACSNVTPDSVHHKTTMPLLAAGKHVLCEKPLAQNAKDATEMAQAAAKAGVVNMVNLVYRTTPEISTAARLFQTGVVGDVRHLQASYLQSWLVGNHWGEWTKEQRWLWRLSTRHGSNGVVGDIGIHILDAALFISQLEPASIHSRIQTFDKAPGNQIGDYPLDANDSALMSIGFRNGALGSIDASRFTTGYANCLKIGVFGTEGALEVCHGGSDSGVRVCTGPDVHTQSWNSVDCPTVASNYATFIDAIVGGTSPQPDFATAAHLQQMLDIAIDRPNETVAL